MFYYLIGIKGCALTALANLLYSEGHIVSGCDIGEDFYTKDKLKQFRIDNIEEVSLKEEYFYIIGNAYINHNITNKIKSLNFQYLYFPDFISKYFKYHKQLCIAGSHGKTTTTSMLSTIVGECNSIIGDGSGSYSDNDILIIESCEYKNTFLKYNPYIALILNIDYDHPDFFSSLDDYIDAFRLFINNSKIVIANGDDENVLKLDLDELITYGMNDYNDYCFSVIEGKNKTLIMINNVRFVIPLVGLHYAYDFVGAYLCAKFIGVSDSDIKSRLKAYKLPSRRLEEKNIDEMIFVNDYAHHPTEINALHDTLRIKYSGYKLVCFFQPHTISRSLALLDEFKEKLSLFDETYIMKTFTSVREGYDKGKEEYIMDYWGFPKVEEFRVLNYNFSKKNVYIFVGAGDINKLFNKIVKI